MSARKIAIIGGASKAAAIVARAAAMRRLGIAGVPKIIVFEPNQLGGSWSGDFGYTDGDQILCTPPEMDVGFPYPPETGLLASDPDPASLVARGHEVAHAVQADFSWTSYLLRSDRTGEQLADYVIRGRSHPTHRQWFEYHQWVFGESIRTGAFAWKQGKVTKVFRTAGPDGRPWTVTWQHGSDADRSDDFDAVILTGTGPPNRLRSEPEDVAPPLCDGRL